MSAKKNFVTGVLAYHGDVIEHIHATKKALVKLHVQAEVIEVRTKQDVQKISSLIIPGGESSIIAQHIEREGVLDDIKKIPSIFGTCAGAILLAKKIYNASIGQKTLELMDIEVDRNAYGRQTDSFEKEVKTTLGNMSAVFIRAPKICKIGQNVTILSKDSDVVIACEQYIDNHYYLALSFHPELTTTLFHEYFILQSLKLAKGSS